jgi:phosphoglycolate phosphatase
VTRRSLIAPTAVIFDFDLTLADSRPGFIASHRFAADRMNVPPPTPEAIARGIGTPIEGVVPGMFPEMTDVQVREYIRHYRDKANEVMAELTEMLPGACETVTRLREAGLKLALVSQKLHSLISAVLKREHMELDLVLGGDEVPAFKPDPGGLLVAMSRLGVEPDDAIYVGDTTIDAEAAANANLRFVGVLTGVTKREEFAAYTSIALLDSVTELPEFLGV